MDALQNQDARLFHTSFNIHTHNSGPSLLVNFVDVVFVLSRLQCGGFSKHSIKKTFSVLCEDVKRSIDLFSWMMKRTILYNRHGFIRSTRKIQTDLFYSFWRLFQFIDSFKDFFFVQDDKEQCAFTQTWLQLKQIHFNNQYLVFFRICSL